MFTKVAPMLLYSVSSVHAGSGSEVGVVDLPIQRERHTGFPKIESSSLKGAIRATVELGPSDREKVELAFGSAPAGGSDQNNQSSVAGALTFSDARILLFPVKSLKGVFAYITCPYVISRFNNDLETYCPGFPLLPIPESNTVSSDLLVVGDKSQIVLEEYTYTVKVDQTTKELADRLCSAIFQTDTGKGRLAGRLVVLSDDEFADFVQLSTEVNARVRVDSKTGIVTSGALWYEENLPPETVLYAFVFAGEPRVNEPEALKSAEEVLGFVKDDEVFSPVFQLGGNNTLGRGMLRRIWLTKEDDHV